MDCNGEAVVVDWGDGDVLIDQMVFELDGTKAVEAVEYLK